MNKTENAKTSGALLECGTNNTLHALSDDFCKQKLLITYSLFELKDESMSKKGTISVNKQKYVTKRLHGTASNYII